MFHPEMHGSLAFFRAILNGERLKEIPNDSMSFIDVRDLAELELAALENKNARGK
jgi:nucleoside-diphosphate-sugar epimerase